MASTALSASQRPRCSIRTRSELTFQVEKRIAPGPGSGQAMGPRRPIERATERMGKRLATEIKHADRAVLLLALLSTRARASPRIRAARRTRRWCRTAVVRGGVKSAPAAIRYDLSAAAAPACCARRAAAITAPPVVVTRSSVSRSHFMSRPQRPTIRIMSSWRLTSWARAWSRPGRGNPGGSKGRDARRRRPLRRAPRTQA